MIRPHLGRRAFLSLRLRPTLFGRTARSQSRSSPTDAARGTPRRGDLRRESQRAKIDGLRCLASVAQVCGACVERCPVDGALRLDGLHPIVDRSLCDGCGECVGACPAPEPAIDLVPKGKP